MTRIIIIGLAFGLVFNIFGWFGKNLWLGEDWDAASRVASNSVELPYPGLVREIISLLPDFIYGVTMVWLYSKTADRSTAGTASFVFVYWLATVAVVYLAIVNSKFLDWEISVKTSLLALVLFAPSILILPRLFGRYHTGPAEHRALTRQPQAKLALIPLRRIQGDNHRPSLGGSDGQG